MLWKSCLEATDINLASLKLLYVLQILFFVSLEESASVENICKDGHENFVEIKKFEEMKSIQLEDDLMSNGWMSTRWLLSTLNCYE